MAYYKKTYPKKSRSKYYNITSILLDLFSVEIDEFEEEHNVRLELKVDPFTGEKELVKGYNYDSFVKEVKSDIEQHKEKWLEIHDKIYCIAALSIVGFNTGGIFKVWDNNGYDEYIFDIDFECIESKGQFVDKDPGHRIAHKLSLTKEGREQLKNSVKITLRGWWPID